MIEPLWFLPFAFVVGIVAWRVWVWSVDDRGRK